MSRSMKIWERVVEARLRQEVQIREQQYNFMPGKSASNAILALNLLTEKYRKEEKTALCVCRVRESMQLGSKRGVVR